MQLATGEIAIVTTDHDIDACFEVIQQLRPHLKREDFVIKVRRMMAQRYQLARIRVTTKVVCVAGFRIHENLFHGKLLYVDDLVTANDFQSQGYGKQLLQWLAQYARANECQHLELDSGVQRFRAHRFYLREGMMISSHHFSMPL